LGRVEVQMGRVWVKPKTQPAWVFFPMPTAAAAAAAAAARSCCGRRGHCRPATRWRDHLPGAGAAPAVLRRRSGHPARVREGERKWERGRWGPPSSNCRPCARRPADGAAGTRLPAPGRREERGRERNGRREGVGF